MPGPRLVMVNATAVRLRGMSREELIGLNALDLSPRPGVGETSLLEDQRVLRGEEIVKEEQSVLPVTGEECFRVVFKRRCFDVDGQPWNVSNYGGSGYGIVDLQKATTESMNTAYAQLELDVGAQRSVDVAHALGIRSDLEPNASIVLGAEQGYRLLWVLLLATVALTIFHSLGSRLGIATGQGLVGLVREVHGVRVGSAVLVALVVANVGTTCADDPTAAGC